METSSWNEFFPGRQQGQAVGGKSRSFGGRRVWKELSQEKPVEAAHEGS